MCQILSRNLTNLSIRRICAFLAHSSVWRELFVPVEERNALKFKRSKRLTLSPMLLLVAAGLQAAPVSGLVNFAGNLSISFSGIQFNPSFISTVGAAETAFSE